jgi:hypothetical protein
VSVGSPSASLGERTPVHLSAKECQMVSYVFRAAPEPPASKRWLTQCFPHRHELIGDLRQRIRRAPAPIAACAPEPGHFGLAVERSLALDLCDTPPYWSLFTSLPEPGRRTLLTVAGYPTLAEAPAPTWRRTGSDVPAARLFTVGSLLTDLHRVAVRTRGVIAPTETQRALRIPLSHCDTFLACATRIRAARPAFTQFWASYIGGFRAALRSYGPVTAAPALLDGLRVADLIAGTTIVELKTGHLTDAHQFHNLIDQILTYVLLAPLDGYPVTAAVVYLARYHVLARYRVDDLTTELADEPIDLAAAGQHLATLIHGETLPAA